MGVGDRRLVDIDFLETPRQGPVFFDLVFVLLVGGRADAAQNTGLQRGFQQIGGIHRAAAGGPGADDGMHLIDKEDGVFLLLDGGHHAFQAFFKIAPVFGAGDQGAHVEQMDLDVPQQVGHPRFFAFGPGFFVFMDAQRQTLGHGRLADAGFADQERIVFLAAAENLHDPVQLVVAADERIDFALRRIVGQVDGKFLQRLGILTGFLRIGASGGEEKGSFCRPSAGSSWEMKFITSSLWMPTEVRK